MKRIEKNRVRFFNQLQVVYLDETKYDVCEYADDTEWGVIYVETAKFVLINWQGKQFDHWLLQEKPKQSIFNRIKNLFR